MSKLSYENDAPEMSNAIISYMNGECDSHEILKAAYERSSIFASDFTLEQKSAFMKLAAFEPTTNVSDFIGTLEGLIQTIPDLLLICNDNNGMTMFHQLVENKAVPPKCVDNITVHLLTFAGINVQDYARLTPLDHAASSSNPYKDEIVDVLKCHGAEHGPKYQEDHQNYIPMLGHLDLGDYK